MEIEPRDGLAEYCIVLVGAVHEWSHWGTGEHGLSEDDAEVDFLG